MNFARFLYEKSLIQGDQLLGAVAAHVASQPPLLSLLINKELLSKEKLLAVSLLQLDKQISAVEAMKELGLWQDDLMHQLTEQATSTTTSIVQYLLQKGVISASQLNKAFDEYMAEVEVPSKISAVAPELEPVPVPVLEAKGSSLTAPALMAAESISTARPTSDVANKPENETHPIATIQSFLELYSTGRHNTLEKLAQALPSEGYEHARDELVRELEVIKAGAKFIKMTSIVTLCEAIVSVLKAASSKQKLASQAAGAAMKKSLSSLWLLREAQRQARGKSLDQKHMALVANQAISALKTLTPNAGPT